MRKIPIKLRLLLLCLAFHTACVGQQIIVGARDELAFNGTINVPMGEKSIGGSPALLANMKFGYSLDLRYTTTLFRHLQVGAWAGGAQFTSWESSVAPKLYAGSSMSFLSAGPALGYRTSPRRITGPKKLGFGAWILPGVSRINVVTSEEAQVNADTSPETLTLQSTRLTIGLNAGLTYVCTSSLGISLVAGYRYTAADSKVFSDTSYSFVQIGAGLFYRIHLDRRFKYSTP